MSSIINYTKMRKGSKPDGVRRIDVCPKCGRKGLASPFRDKGMQYNHLAKDMGLGLLITDHCYVSLTKQGVT